MITTPIRLTVDEMAAIARLAAVTPPEYVTSTDALVESGMRSLTARNFFRGSDEDGKLIVASNILDLVVALSTSEQYVVLTRAGSSGDRAGRVVLVEGGPGIIEEFVYPGVVALTPIDPSKLLAFLVALFGLEGDGLLDADSEEGRKVAATINATGSGPGVSADGWKAPELSSLIVVTSPSAAVPVQWVVEGKSRRALWLLEPGEAKKAAKTVPARSASSADVVTAMEAALAGLRLSAADAQ